MAPSHPEVDFENISRIENIAIESQLLILSKQAKNRCFGERQGLPRLHKKLVNHLFFLRHKKFGRISEIFGSFLIGLETNQDMEK